MKELNDELLDTVEAGSLSGSIDLIHQWMYTEPWRIFDMLQKEELKWLDTVLQIMEQCNLTTFPCYKHFVEARKVNTYKEMSAKCGFDLFCELYNIPFKETATKENKFDISNSKKMLKKRKVQCIETGQLFDSCADAGREFGVGRNTITKCCNGMRKSPISKKQKNGKSLKMYNFRYVDVNSDGAIVTEE